MAVRDLKIKTTWIIEKDPIERAEEATDDLVESIIEADDAFDKAGDTATESMAEVEDAAEGAGDSLEELGDVGVMAADEITKAMEETADAVEDVGERGMLAMNGLETAIAGVVGAGLTAWGWSAAATLEVAESRVRAFVDTEKEFEDLIGTMDDVVAASQGIHRRGELLEAAHAAMMLGTDVEAISEVMQEAAMIAAATGYDVQSVFFGIGRAVEHGTTRQLERMGVVSREELAEMEDELGGSIRQWSRAEREQFILQKTQEHGLELMGWYTDYLETATARTDKLSGAVGDLSEVAGEPLLRPLGRMITKLTEIIDIAIENPAGTLAIQFGGLTTAFGGSLFAIKLVTGALAKAGIGMGALSIGPLAVLGTGIIGTTLFINDFRKAWEGYEDTASEAIYNTIMDLLGLDASFEEMVESRRAHYDRWEGAETEFWSNLGLGAENNLKKIDELWQKFWPWSDVETPEMTGVQIPTLRGLQQGAILPGHGGGDRIPALLEAGEAVVPADVVQGGMNDIAGWFRSMGVAQMQGGGIVEKGWIDAAKVPTHAEAAQKVFHDMGMKMPEGGIVEDKDPGWLKEIPGLPALMAGARLPVRGWIDTAGKIIEVPGSKIHSEIAKVVLREMGEGKGLLGIPRGTFRSFHHALGKMKWTRYDMGSQFHDPYIHSSAGMNMEQIKTINKLVGKFNPKQLTAEIGSSLNPEKVKRFVDPITSGTPVDPARNIYSIKMLSGILRKFTSNIGGFQPFFVIEDTLRRVFPHIFAEPMTMQAGGILPGYGGGDRIPAMLEPGEAVVPARTVRGGITEITDWFRGMHEGGIVGEGSLSDDEEGGSSPESLKALLRIPDFKPTIQINGDTTSDQRKLIEKIKKALRESSEEFVDAYFEKLMNELPEVTD